MRQITARRWFSRLTSWTALVCGFLFALDYPLHAQATLVVSNYGNDDLSFFNSIPSLTATSPIVPLTPLGASGSTEGEACLAGGTYQIYVADNTDSIFIYNVNSPTGAGLFNVSPFATVSGALFSSLALSRGGSTLYAADWNHGIIYAFATGASTAPPPTSSPVLVGGVHDIAVDPNDPTGYVYATNFQNTGQGVARLDKTLATVLYNFILQPIGASRFAGMTFDGSDNLWVSDFAAVGASPYPGVYEFINITSTPTLKGAGITSSLFNNPLGLAYNPTDHNIYVANFTAGIVTSGANSVLEINTSTNTVGSTAFISSGLSHPKYLGFLQNCTTTSNVTADAPYQVHYFSNLAIGDSVINVTNTGANGAGNGSGTAATVTGAICANFYVFDQTEETVACCSCAVTPDGLDSLSLQKDLIFNPLFNKNNAAGVVVKVLATAPTGSTPSCTNSSLLGGNPAPVNGLVLWGTNLHANTVVPGQYQVTETAFTPSTLSGYNGTATAATGEYARLQYSCGVAVGQGSGGGICHSCAVGGLGGVRQ
jgi:hypothetical protein